MQILILGSGGREHALAWKAAQSKQTKKVYVAPGNGGTAKETKVENVNLDLTDHRSLIEFVKSQQVDLTIVGPEAPLVEGVVDAFNAAGCMCFGPVQAAAQLEGSKSFCKDFLKRHQIPTAAYETFENTNKALAYLNGVSFPLVIKADGLAQGKGVVIAQDREEAEKTIHDMLEGNRFDTAGHRIIIEEFLQGDEASFICMLDGKTILPLATSQDHKARDDGDQGPNTGGMGAYSPTPLITPELHKRVMKEVFEATLAGLKAEGIEYKGFLYAGLMIDKTGSPKVLEFNCRFGDPETQPILMRLESDLTELCIAGVQQKLDQHLKKIKWSQSSALCVVIASGGYPFAYEKGYVIHGLDKTPETETLKVFHAGTALDEAGKFKTAGGRVLAVTAMAPSLGEAYKQAYEGAKAINWPKSFYRKDIGHKAL